MDYTILAIPGAALFRSVAGWIENACEDGKIDRFEWTQLGSTVLRFVVLGIGFMLGLHLGPTTAAGAAVVTDLGFAALKKAGTK